MTLLLRTLESDLVMVLLSNGAGRYAMNQHPLPRDAIFIKWGKFQAGASGKWAITALIVAITFGLVGRALALW
jgi:hypothetical protein